MQISENRGALRIGSRSQLQNSGAGEPRWQKVWATLVAIPISTSQRRTALSVRRLGQQHLIKIQPVRPKSVRGGCHVEPPDAIRCLVGDASYFLNVRFQPTHPVLKGQSIVLAQVLDISYFKTASFRLAEAGAEWHQFAIGKHVAVDERWSLPVIGSIGSNPGI